MRFIKKGKTRLFFLLNIIILVILLGLTYPLYKFISHINDIIQSEPTLVVSNAFCDADNALVKKYWPNAEIKNIEIHHFSLILEFDFFF